MAIVPSNTYIEATAGTSFNISRLYNNDSLRSLLTNFRSTVAPTSVNIIAEGVAIGPQDGTLHWNASNKALYVEDSEQVKSSPIGGNFTRAGIGHRLEEGISSLAINASTYEIGELVATVSSNALLSSNARLYLATGNTRTMADFIDVGIPPGMELSTDSNLISTGQSLTASILVATSNVSIGKNNPSEALDIVGSIVASGDISSASDIRLKSNIHTIDNALSKVSSMRGVYFIKNGLESTGVIAQEIENILPEVVSEAEYKSVAYGNIVGVLIEAIKELQVEIQKLKN